MCKIVIFLTIALVVNTTIITYHKLTIYTIIMIDIDECTEWSNIICERNAHCNNSPGRYECICIEGYEMVNNICQGEFLTLNVVVSLRNC